MKSGASVTFSTGATIPNTRLAGTLFDWVAGTTPRTGLLEAIALPDSVVYLARVDSVGQFAFPHIPPGRYLLRGWLDANNNRDLDEREAFDSTFVELTDTARVDLLAFVHDTLPPRINTVTPMDSVTLRVELNQPLDPSQAVDTSLFRLTASDSSIVPLQGVQTERAWQQAQLDSLARLDTIRPPPVPRPGVQVPPPRPDTIVLPRPSPSARFVIVVARPLAADSSYRLIAVEARNLMGRAATTARVFTMPRRSAPPDTVPPAVRPPR
jgi:hypothetical protein